MKKIMCAAAVVAMAIGVQAATIKWGTSGGVYSDSTGAATTLFEVKTAEAVLFGERIIVTPYLPSRAPDTLRFSMTENPPSNSLIKSI